MTKRTPNPTGSGAIIALLILIGAVVCCIQFIRLVRRIDVGA